MKFEYSLFDYLFLLTHIAILKRTRSDYLNFKHTVGGKDTQSSNDKKRQSKFKIINIQKEKKIKNNIKQREFLRKNGDNKTQIKRFKKRESSRNVVILNENYGFFWRLVSYQI